MKAFTCRFTLYCLALLYLSLNTSQTNADSVSSKAAVDSLCGCGPDYCTNDPRYGAALDNKKRRLSSSGYPPELVSLLDKGAKCIARVEQAPDGFSILSVASNGEKLETAWDKSQEEAIRGGMKNGKFTDYYKFNTRHSFQCCSEPSYRERDDYNTSHDVNTDIAIHCKKSGSEIKCN